MRQILFRGKRVDNGEWVEGDLLRCNGFAYIVQEKEVFGSPINTTASVEVHPETVGQFTGLLDKNGKKIFEGDIVRIFCSERDPHFEHAVIWKNGSFGYESEWTGFISFAGNHNFEWKDGKSSDIRIVGTIHDSEPTRTF